MECHWDFNEIVGKLKWFFYGNILFVLVFICDRKTISSRKIDCMSSGSISSFSLLSDAETIFSLIKSNAYDFWLVCYIFESSSTNLIPSKMDFYCAFSAYIKIVIGEKGTNFCEQIFSFNKSNRFKKPYHMKYPIQSGLGEIYDFLVALTRISFVEWNEQQFK